MSRAKQTARFKIPNSAPPIAEDLSGEPKREVGCRFREPKPALLSNGDGERETFRERLVQVIWGGKELLPACRQLMMSLNSS
jgi:hypothetical protein